MFDGRVFVLTSHYTFSSASAFASMIKANGLGKIIGEPTGGYASCYGDVFSFSLSHTYLRCEVSHKFFIGPDGSTVPAPLQPDYQITPEDENRETDRVMEKAVKLTRL